MDRFSRVGSPHRAVFVAALASIVALGAHAKAAGVKRVSIDRDGLDSSASSTAPSISATGRFVAFSSSASDLVGDDTNDLSDVFVRDLKKGVTRRVSLDSIGIEGNGLSTNAAISANGRFVAFQSDASNLVAGDANHARDVFVHDRKKRITTRVSVDSSGLEANSHSSKPSISADGRFVAFESDATNLVANDANAKTDVFVHDRVTGATIRVSVDSVGNEAVGGVSLSPVIAAGGRFVAFQSFATNLVADDGSSLADVFVHDLQTHETERVSVTSDGSSTDGNASSPAISADGRIVAFVSTAPDLVPADANDESDVFVHDRTTGVTTRVAVNSAGIEENDNAGFPSLSANGRYVAFESRASNLILGDTNGVTDVFVHDRKKHATSRVSAASRGADANQQSRLPRLAKNGKLVVCQSDASNLVTGDDNGETDVYLFKRKN